MEQSIPKQKKISYFIGIDVSKNELDYAVIHGKQLLFHVEGKNESKDITAFLARLRALPGFTIGKSIFCMENTGFYCNHLVRILEKKRANIVLENPLHIKRSLGIIRSKDDKADAIRIATFAQRNVDYLKFRKPQRPLIDELENLLSLRNRLAGVFEALRTPLNEQRGFINPGIQKGSKKLCTASIEGIKADIAAIELKMAKLINGDERLNRLKEIIISVPCIGPMTATQIIISTNEFLKINCPKKFASYAGIAPFINESGLIRRRTKISNIANKKVKRLLHLCALTAVRVNPKMRTYYEKKTKSELKPKLLVLNAVRNKLVSQIFSCVNQDRFYDKDRKPGNITAIEPKVVQAS